MTGIILAGGKALRMGGADKAFLEIDDEPIIKRQLRCLKRIFKEIIIVTNSVKEYKHLRGVRVVSDVLPDRGPLGGIYSGLLASKSSHNFIAACDMPFLSFALIKYIVASSDAYDIIIPKIKKKFHPLFGVYSKNCIPAIEEALKRDRLKVAGIFSKVKVRFLSQREIKGFDKNMLSLLNINTPDELQRVKLGEDRI